VVGISASVIEVSYGISSWLVEVLDTGSMRFARAAYRGKRFGFAKS
jgi:hypothetical protein